MEARRDPRFRAECRDPLVCDDWEAMPDARIPVPAGMTVVSYRGDADAWGGVYHRIAALLEPKRDRVRVQCDPLQGILPPSDCSVLVVTSMPTGRDVIAALPALRLI